MTPSLAAPGADLVERIDALLPQTQCTKCGFAGCRPYAQALADGEAAINRCPPGGRAGIDALAALLGRPPLPLDPACGAERPRLIAVVDEAHCIGCTKCIVACPVDAIIGATRRMHTVVAELCSGCDLCVPACPVDCISMVDATSPRTGWAAWSAEQAAQARARHDFRADRLRREAIENDLRLAAKAQARLDELQAAPTSGDDQAQASKRAIVEAALERARKLREA